jgi:hypothetical protein
MQEIKRQDDLSGATVCRGLYTLDKSACWFTLAFKKEIMRTAVK